MKNFFAILFLCFATLSAHVRACDINDHPTSYDASDRSNSMAVTADQIVVTENAMFVHIDHELIPVKSIYMEDGIYNCLLLDFHLCLGRCTWCNRVVSIGAQSCPNVKCVSNLYPEHYKFRYQIIDP